MVGYEYTSLIREATRKAMAGLEYASSSGY
jgi:hypothetical protein